MSRTRLKSIKQQSQALEVIMRLKLTSKTKSSVFSESKGTDSFICRPDAKSVDCVPQKMWKKAREVYFFKIGEPDGLLSPYRQKNPPLSEHSAGCEAQQTRYKRIGLSNRPWRQATEILLLFAMIAIFLVGGVQAQTDCQVMNSWLPSLFSVTGSECCAQAAITCDSGSISEF
jgi:hypothetical protein